MKKKTALSWKEGQLVVVNIRDGEHRTGWFLAIIVKIEGDRYRVRVSFPKECATPIYVVPKPRRWYQKGEDREISETERERNFEYEWASWMSLPEDQSFVLLARCTSRSFRDFLKKCLSESTGSRNEFVVEGDRMMSPEQGIEKRLL